MELTQVLKQDEIVGKTILRTVANSIGDEELFLFFTDNTFCVFRSYYEGNEIYFSENLFETRKQFADYRVLHHLGMLSDEEYDSIHQRKKNEEAESIKQREIEALKKLKAKYPDQA